MFVLSMVRSLYIEKGLLPSNNLHIRRSNRHNSLRSSHHKVRSKIHKANRIPGSSCANVLWSYEINILLYNFWNMFTFLNRTDKHFVEFIQKFMEKFRWCLERLFNKTEVRECWKHWDRNENRLNFQSYFDSILIFICYNKRRIKLLNTEEFIHILRLSIDKNILELYMGHQ